MSAAGDVKARRAALGWDRARLARQAGLDRSVVQLVELGQWSERDALERVATVLAKAEAGETAFTLPPLAREPDA
ncbi:MAG: hypothetical protein R3F59_11415 [Myxococcota bacterium]